MGDNAAEQPPASPRPPAPARAPNRSPPGQQGPGRQRGNKNIMGLELKFLFNLIETILSICHLEWVSITSQHSVEAEVQQWTPRSQDTLKQKFMRTVNTQKPTGHATEPGHVTWALRIWDKILQKTAIQESGHEVSDGDSDRETRNEANGAADENAAPQNVPAESTNRELRDVNKRRSRVDSAMNGLAQAMVARGSGGNNLAEQLILMEARREEREARQHTEQLQREAAREEREAEREARREERDERNQQQFFALLSAIRAPAPATTSGTLGPARVGPSSASAFTAPRNL